jgi:hypothetical protein
MLINVELLGNLNIRRADHHTIAAPAALDDYDNDW